LQGLFIDASKLTVLREINEAVAIQLATGYPQITFYTLIHINTDFDQVSFNKLERS